MLAVFSSLWASYYVVSVAPIVELQNREIWLERTCTVTNQRLKHDVSIGLTSSWLAELDVIYNRTKGVTSITRAFVQQSVTGQYGLASEMNAFLSQPNHQIGKTFACYVHYDIKMWAASASNQNVTGSVIAAMVGLGILALAFFVFVAKTSYNLYKFRAYYTWNADIGVWIVEGRFGKQQKALPP